MHETYMQRCIELAKEAKAKGDVPVGSLVLQGETIVAEAYEIVPSTRTVTGYAEIIAVQKACDALGTMNLQDCTLYTTAEPCWMCTYAIRETGIAQVVIGSKTLDVGAISTKYKLLTDDTITVWGAPPTIVMGVLEAECDALRD